MAVNFLTEEKIWFDKYKYDDAEMHYHIQLNGPTTTTVQNPPAVQENGASNILRDIARARENIQKSLAGISSVWEADSNPKETAQDNVNPISSHSAVQGADIEVCARVTSLEKENQSLHKAVEALQLALSKLEVRLSTVERSSASTKPAVCPPAPHNKPEPKKAEVDDDDDIDLFGSSDEEENAESERIREERIRQYAEKKSKKPTLIAKSSILLDVKPPEPKKAEEDDDDDIDLFGSSDEEENAESERIREERIRQYTEKKSKKPTLIAKSSILLDVKPWDDETDMVKLEELVRTVQMDGLLWGTSKLIPVGYGIKKLQIQCVVEDDKVGTDQLEDEITKFEDYVQSIDVAAFNKI